MERLQNIGHAPKGGVKERRKEPRWPAFGGVSVLPFSSAGGFTQAQVLDFSDHGLGLSVTVSMRVDDQFAVKAIGLQNASLAVYTVQSSVADDGHFRVGAKFSGTLGSSTIDADVVRATFVEWLEATARSTSHD